MSTLVEQQTQSHINSSYPHLLSPVGVDESQAAHSNMASFDGRPASFHSQPTPQHMYHTSPPHSQTPVGAYRSFSDNNGYATTSMEKPQIYTAIYSGVQVYEMEINGVAVMKRRSDAWLNATQILKVAGVDKGKRTKVLEKEILTGTHEKVQGGYGKYQGTWVDYKRGRQFCREYLVEDMLRPLLDYDMSHDGSGVPGNHTDTPTKEQAMAANRKRMYNASMDGGRPQQAQSAGTFFSNISSTASNAIAAMNKVARMNSPAPPRPGSAQVQRQGNASNRPSVPPLGSQDSFRAASQQSQQSIASERSFNGNGGQDSAYATQSNPFGTDGQLDGRLNDFQEPPRKRLRQEDSFSQAQAELDTAMRDGSPTEPNESFVYQQMGLQTSHHDDDGTATALSPLPSPSTKSGEDKQAILLDLFTDQNRTDYTNHPAIVHLSGSDLDLPLDQSANTALHWAATLARVSLLRLLISKGANIFRGNIAGQTPLMSAVLVNNSLDHSCFPEILESLAPLIEVRDAQGRSLLHHIAVACGIKGRAASSKYYLEALLEFLVRNTGASNSQSSFDGGAVGSGLHGRPPVGLMRFMSEMVNARDKAGNTALNLVARIGNRSIIQQLLEVQADATIPNYKGIRPIDFGVGSDPDRNGHTSISQMSSPSKSKAASKVEETSRDMMQVLNGFLSQTESQFQAEVRLKQDQIDQSNARIRELSALQKTETARLETLRRHQRERNARQRRILNLRRAIHEQRSQHNQAGNGALMQNGAVTVGDADTEAGGNIPSELGVDELDPSQLSPSSLTALSHPQRSILFNIPPPSALKSRLDAYIDNNRSLRTKSAALKQRNGELEQQYRKVVGLCCGMSEQEVDGMLPNLVAAVESEDGLMETGRIREFLRKVEGVGEA